MLKESFWGPVGGQKRHARTAFLPPTPLKKLFMHTFLSLIHVKLFVFKSFFFFPFLFIFLSCASISPIDSALEKPERFAQVENVIPMWRVFAQGVGYFHGKIVNPRLEFWALQIDLRAAGTRVVVHGGAAPDSGGGGFLSTRVSSLVRDNFLIAGINAVPFDVSSSKEGQTIKNMGVVISGGKMLAPANPRYDALVFYQNGTAAVVSQSSIGSAENIENAVGAFHHILVNGEPAQRTIGRERRYARSAAGIAQDSGCLYLLVIDGSRAGSIGATERETALLLRALGSLNGINLDGGGSSALALRFPDGKTRVVNTPAHAGILGLERAVAGCLGVVNER